MTPRKAFALAMVSMMDLFVVIKVTCCQRDLAKRRNIGNLRLLTCWMWTTETGTQKHRQAQKQKYKQKKETQTNTVCEKHKPLFLCLCHIPSMIGQYWKRVSLDMLDMAKENWKFKDDLCWLPVVASGTISTMCPDWLDFSLWLLQRRHTGSSSRKDSLGSFLHWDSSDSLGMC